MGSHQRTRLSLLPEPHTNYGERRRKRRRASLPCSPSFRAMEPLAQHPRPSWFDALTVEHGAPLRLLVPVKLGLKNVKPITRITYSATKPADYLAERGYSYYDGI